MSTHNPMTSAERTKLCEDLVRGEIAFFSVPLGPRLDPQNLHGLASGTGGMVVRVLRTDTLNDTMQRLREAVAAPILYPKSFHIDREDVVECFPTTLPPLRGDAPTLVVGRVKPCQELGYTVEGTVVQTSPEIRISRKLAKGKASLDLLRQMYENRLPVEAKVTARNKGGFDVNVGGLRAFCPLSQIGLGKIDDPDQFINQTYEFRITELSDDGRRVMANVRDVDALRNMTAEAWEGRRVKITNDGSTNSVADA